MPEISHVRLAGKILLKPPESLHVVSRNSCDKDRVASVRQDTTAVPNLITMIREFTIPVVGMA